MHVVGLLGKGFQICSRVENWQQLLYRKVIFLCDHMKICNAHKIQYLKKKDFLELWNFNFNDFVYMNKPN